MSPDFPITPGAYDATLGGPYDPYVAKFNRDGSALVYSTLVDGSGPESALGLAVDLWRSAYISGETPSPDFPTTPGAFDRTFNGEFDVFVTKLTGDGSALAYSTFLGGGGHNGSGAVAVNRLGEAYVSGFTGSADFPTTADALARTRKGTSDAFLTILTRNGSGLAFSSYLGGSGFDTTHDVAVDLVGAAHLSGTTVSTDLPHHARRLRPDLQRRGRRLRVQNLAAMALASTSLEKSAPTSPDPVEEQHRQEVVEGPQAHHRSERRPSPRNGKPLLPFRSRPLSRR